MFSEIRIQNFKSIQDLTLKPGRVTVLIGENGSGKSNILEAIGFAAGAGADKLDNEYLYNRGIRVTEHAWMQSAFTTDSSQEAQSPNKNAIQFTFSCESVHMLDCVVKSSIRDDKGGAEVWTSEIKINSTIGDGIKKKLPNDQFLKIIISELIKAMGGKDELLKRLENVDLKNLGVIDVNNAPEVNALVDLVRESQIRKYFFETINLTGFLVYAPENTCLRKFEDEGAIQPLGTKGEGLLKLLQIFSEEKSNDELIDLKERLHLFGWFEDFIAPGPGAMIRAQLQIKDRWLAPALFDQRSANEGFLFVLFYFALLMSKRTPQFFAIDNIDTALNPRLCAELMKQIVELAKKYDKQVICTTHNPAILDGLDLKDDDQRLFVVNRDSEGRTIAHRIRGPQPQPGEKPVRLSIAFLRGLIGGLPENF